MQESACNAEDLGSIPGSERSPGEGNGNPLQYSCLEKPTDIGAWQAIVHGVGRVEHDLETKPLYIYIYIYIHTHTQEEGMATHSSIHFGQHYKGYSR